MFAWIIESLAWNSLKGLVSCWWAGFTRKKELHDAVEPYKKELAIKERPAGSDDDLVDRL